MKARQKLKITDVFKCALSGAFLGIGLNLVFFWLELPQNSASYNETAAAQYSLPLWQGLLLYGLVTPITEEIIYRGILHRFLRRFWKLFPAVLLSALVFALVHGNPVQGAYAFLMGAVMALWYEKYGNLQAPILFHCGANISVYLLTVL